MKNVMVFGKCLIVQRWWIGQEQNLQTSHISTQPLIVFAGNDKMTQFIKLRIDIGQIKKLML
jgi:hypothetical protein